MSYVCVYEPLTVTFFFYKLLYCGMSLGTINVGTISLPPVRLLKGRLVPFSQHIKIFMKILHFRNLFF